MAPEKTALYTIPLKEKLGVGLSILTGKKRSFREDAEKLTGRLIPPILVSGEQNIPGQGNFIITVNHYTRPGFNAWWIAIAISAALGDKTSQDIHWIMTNSWRVENKWYSAGLRSFTKWVFSRLARIYGFSTTPSIPGRPGDEEERAQSVRRIFSQARSKTLPIIGYLPEGRDFAGARLGWPPNGSGRFVHQLNHMGYKILPAGLYEEDGRLHLRFGVPYDLGEFHSHSSGDVDSVTFRLLTRHQIDLLLTRTIMRHIAILLPENLRGEFGK